MTLSDSVADAMSMIRNAEKVGKAECIARPASKLLGNVLKVMQKEGYIGEFEFVDDGTSGRYKISLLGKINQCGSIKPRIAAKTDEYTKFEKRFLPAANIGILVISTSRGLMTQREAIKMHEGGKLVAYVY